MVFHTLPWHILATDDDPAICALLDELLTDEGYRVSLSSAQDVAEVTRLGPDLILLDYWDTSVNAPSDFLDRLKAEQTTAAIPIVILSGARHLANIHAVRFAAFSVTVVSKPFSIDDLLARIAVRLHGAREALYTTHEVRPGSANHSQAKLLNSRATSRPLRRSFPGDTPPALAEAHVPRQAHPLPTLANAASQAVITRIVPVRLVRRAGAPHPGAAGARRIRRIDTPPTDADRLATAGAIEAATAPHPRAAVPRPVVIQAVPGADQRRVGSQTLRIRAAWIARPCRAMMCCNAPPGPPNPNH